MENVLILWLGLCLVPQLVGVGIYPHDRCLACVYAYAIQLVRLCHHRIIPCIAIGRILHFVAYLVFSLFGIAALGDILVCGTLHILQQVVIGNIFCKPHVLSVAVVTACVRVLHTAHDTCHFKLITSSVCIALIESWFKLDIHIQLPALGQRQVYGYIASCRGNVRYCQRLCLAVAFLVGLVGMGSLVQVKSEVVHQLPSKSGGIVHCFLLGIAHITVCLVEVLFHLVGLIVAKQGKLLVHLFEAVINSLFGCAEFVSVA